MRLERLRIQDIFSSLLPLIYEFYHLSTEWRGERSTVEEAELCLDSITRSYLDTENNVSCGPFLSVCDSLLGIQSFVHGFLTFICISVSDL